MLTPAVLPDIRTRIGVDQEELSRGLAIGHIGAFLGSALSSLADRYEKYLFLSNDSHKWPISRVIQGCDLFFVSHPGIYISTIRSM